MRGTEPGLAGKRINREPMYVAGNFGKLARMGLVIFGVAAYLAAVVAVGSLIEARSPTPSPSPTVRSLETPEGLPHYMADPKGAAERVEQLARRTNGNWDGLTKAEQNWINGMTAGYGHELLWNQCRLLRIKPEGPPPPDRGRRASRSGPSHKDTSLSRR